MRKRDEKEPINRKFLETLGQKIEKKTKNRPRKTNLLEMKCFQIDFG